MRLRGPRLKLAAGGFVASFAIALTIGLMLVATGSVGASVLVAIILSATSLGVVIPVLKDAGEAETAFGQLVIAAASIADFATIILLSLFFSRESAGPTAQLLLLGSFALLALAIFAAVRRTERSMRISDTLVRLQDTTAQIRVRGAFVLLIAFVALAENLGLEVILGAFVAGAPVPGADRPLANACGGPAPGHLAAVHRRLHNDRARARRYPRGGRRRPGGCRLLSVVVFPLIALAILGRERQPA